jgi:hypothetical protein
VCVSAQPLVPGLPPGTAMWPVPSSAAAAVAMACDALNWLSAAGDLTATERAECLRGLERVESVHTAARSVVLAAFSAAGDCADDGHGSARSWLKWQTRVTGAAAAGAVGWMRRLNGHRAVSAALAAGRVSSSWARQICDWSDLLPETARGDADVILLAAAEGGAELADLAGLAEEMHKRTAPPNHDGDDDGFADRSVRLDLHYRGAGKLDGELTPQCAAALQAVLDALGKKAGPEDLRTQRQRDHDALEEACRRLAASGCLPDRAGQPTQIQLNMNLSQFTRPGTAGTGSSRTGSSGTGPPGTGSSGTGPPGTGRDGSVSDGTGVSGAAGGAGTFGPGHGPLPVPWPTAGPGYDCDATIVPVLTGHIDSAVLDRLAALLIRPGNGPGRTDTGITNPCDAGGADATSKTGSADTTSNAGSAGALGLGYARELVLREAIALLSGPTGLAAWLRTSQLTGPAASISLPLDTGTATDTIPAHLRRAVIRRDRHCAWPGGCDQPWAACQVHHVIPRSRGGSTALTNLGLFCTFHHLIVIHRWGWNLVLHADGTYTATSPDRTRTLRTHSPPATAA